jgi:hypothetical protein
MVFQDRLFVHQDPSKCSVAFKLKEGVQIFSQVEPHQYQYTEYFENTVKASLHARIQSGPVRAQRAGKRKNLDKRKSFTTISFIEKGACITALNSAVVRVVLS